MQRFTLKKDHIKLLRSSYVSWNYCEFGAPSIDCKRPYGNSEVYSDMVKILAIKDAFTGDEDDGYEVKDSVIRKLAKIHGELETALQVVLHTGKFKPGVYEADDYDRNWKLFK